MNGLIKHIHRQFGQQRDGWMLDTTMDSYGQMVLLKIGNRYLDEWINRCINILMDEHMDCLLRRCMDRWINGITDTGLNLQTDRKKLDEQVAGWIDEKT